MRSVPAITALALIVLLAAGCATKQKAPTLEQIVANRESALVSRKSEAPEAGEKAQKEGTEEIALPGYLPTGKPRPPAPVPPPAVQKEPIDAAKLVSQKKPIMINVENMALADFITYGIGETLKVNFFVDDAVKKMKNPITLRMTKEMPPAQVLEVALEVLDRQGVSAEVRSGTLFFGKPQPPPPPRKPLDIGFGRNVETKTPQVLQVVPLRYIKGGEAMQLINEYYKTGVQMKSYNPDTLFISGPSQAVREVVGFLELMDVPYLRDKKVLNIRLKYWQPEDFIRQMTVILEGLGLPVSRLPKEPGALFIPIRFLNSVLLISSDENLTKVILGWKERLDTAESAGQEEKAFVYYPLYSRATELVEAVRRLHGIMPVSPQVQQQGARTVAPVGGEQAAAAASLAAGPAAAARTQSSTATMQGLKISADDRRNLVMIVTTPGTYRIILTLFEELDKPLRQVLIETTFAELTLKDDLKFGLEWYIQNTMDGGPYRLGTLFGTGTSAPGLTYSFLSETGRFRVLMNAFAQKNLINILSAPRILVLDNSEAQIQIGTEVPIVTSEQSVTSTTVEQPTVLRNIQYRQTGVTLRVRPTINTEGALTLSISQEVSEAQTNAYSNIDSPMILTRRMSTQVIGESGQTIVLGGLMGESSSGGENKVPFIGDIPVLGYLFKTQSQAKTRTELIILMTPVILASTDDVVNITQELRQGLKWLQ